MSPPAAWLPELRSALPRDAVVDDPDVVAGYSRDMAMLAANGRPAEVVHARRIALPALEQLGSTLIDDVAVPRSKISEFLDRTTISEFLDRTTEIACNREVIIGVVGHAGDGNMHPTICFDPTDADQHQRAFAAFNDILEVGLSLGGTVTGEHGVGNLKTDWLAREIGPVGLRVHAAIKAALDPLGIMNPDKIFASGSAVESTPELAAVGR